MAVIENTTYRLAHGADEVAFLAADYRAQTEFFPFQRGFLRRTTARGDDGQWLSAVVWWSLEDALAGARAAADDPAAQGLAAALDAGSVVVTRFTTLD